MGRAVRRAWAGASRPSPQKMNVRPPREAGTGGLPRQRSSENETCEPGDSSDSSRSERKPVSKEESHDIKL